MWWKHLWWDNTHIVFLTIVEYSRENLLPIGWKPANVRNSTYWCYLSYADTSRYDDFLCLCVYLQPPLGLPSRVLTKPCLARIFVNIYCSNSIENSTKNRQYSKPWVSGAGWFEMVCYLLILICVWLLNTTTYQHWKRCIFCLDSSICATYLVWL
jgi:hypothetical protein